MFGRKKHRDLVGKKKPSKVKRFLKGAAIAGGVAAAGATIKELTAKKDY